MKKAIFRERYYNTLELDIVIYCAWAYKIGGIESWIYYVAKKYNIGQITLLYKIIDDEQKERLEPLLNLVEYKGQIIKCNKIIFTEPRDIEQELYDTAKERYLALHCNYRDGFEYLKIPEMTRIYAVSNVAKECFEKIQEKEVFTLYCPVEIDEPRKLLKLISATRLRKEKGSERMKIMADELDKKGIPYIWLIFTDKIPEEEVSENIILMKPRYNMSDYIKEADYGVQLSDDESYCLFVQECLKLNVPVIVTDLPVYKEAGITRKEAYKLKLNMSNLDVEKIYNKIPKVVNYKPKNSDKEYRKLLGGEK